MGRRLLLLFHVEMGLFARAALLALALGFALLAGCGDSGPSAPTPASNEPTAAGTTVPAAGTVAGRLVDALTGEPVGSARVSVAGAPTVSVDLDGTFRVEGVALGHATVVLEAEGYFRRETRMRPLGDGEVAVAVDLLPDGKDFDLGFFDHVFRKLGEQGTHPWAAEPAFEIWETVFECSAFVAGQACEEMTALDEEAPGSFVQRARDVIANDARQYTDGRVTGASVSTRSHPAGTVLSSAAFIEGGKIVVALVERPDTYSWSFWRWGSDGSMRAGFAQINRRHRDLRGVYSHELAHTLGFNHPLGLDAVPLNSIMRRGHGDGPTRVDVLHGRILYSRPANSRTPDVDPPTYSLNGMRTAGSVGVGDVVESAP